MVDVEMNLLDYLRSKTQVDVDSLDIEGRTYSLEQTNTQPE